MKLNKKILIVSIFIILATTLVLMGACLDFSSPLGKTNLDVDSEIIFEKSSYLYTGEEIKPSVIVKHREEVVDAKNYTLTFSNNVNAGTASVKAEGKGDYIGSVSATFEIGFQYTFNVNGVDSVDGETSQFVTSKELVVPPTVEKAGYEFSHWSLDSQPIDFSDSENLPSSGEFVANFILKTYAVTYFLEVTTEDGNKVATNHSDNKNNYTVEEYFALKDAKLTGMQFAGWYLDSEHKNRITSIEGYAQDLNLYAKFVDYTAKTIEYRVPNGADAIPIDLFMPETDIEYLNSQYAQTKEIDGTLKKLVWYGDSNYTTRHVFREMPNQDVIVYGQWEEVLKAGFLDKVDEFKSNNVSIGSFEELVDYIDYVCFENIVSSVDSNSDEGFVSITYVTEEKDVQAEIRNALDEISYPRMAQIYSLPKRGKFKIALKNDIVDVEASKYATAEENFIPQIGNIFALQSEGRGDYETFPIDFVNKAYEVETSNQLFYVLSHGYRPIPKAGSKAEIVYKYFRDVMHEICDDSMSDVDKARAIYEWIILQVRYDYAVAEADDGAEAKLKPYLYDAFYLEGVLRGSAVCDGISKAYSVMCAIECIDCVRVTGENNGGGHAWNKVRLGGKWYLSDATWGNQNNENENGVREYEFISYKYFLFTDEERELIDGYGKDKQNYTYYVADTEFDNESYYSSRKVEINNKKADFYIDSDEELSYLLDYIDRHFDGSKLAGQSFEIMVNPNVIIDKKPVNSKVNGSTVNSLMTSGLTILRNRRGLTDKPKIKVGSYSLDYVGDDDKYAMVMYTFK